jgi:hypothetical protein
MHSSRLALLLLLLPACDGEPTGVDPDLIVTPSVVVVTMGDFSYVPDEAERTRIEVSDAEGPLLATDWQEPGVTRISVSLMALPAASTLEARVVNEAGDELTVVEFKTGSLPSEVPVLTLTGEPGWTGYNFTGILGTVNVALVLDERGQVAWYHPTKDQLVLSRVRLRPDNAGITFIMAPGGAGDVQYLADVDWNSPVEAKFADRLHVTHDFVFLSDDTMAALVTTRVTHAGNSFMSGAVVELDRAGASTVVWEIEATWPDGVQAEGEYAGAHVNTLTYDAEADWLWWTVANADCLLGMDRASTGVQTILGGRQSDYTFPNDDGLLSPHHIWFTGDSIRIHDNRDVNSNSRIVEYTLDNTAMRATRTGEWFHDPPVFDFALGDVHMRPDGSMIVTWSSSGLIDDFGPDGELRASIAAPFGAAFGYGELHDTLPGQVRLR